MNLKTTIISRILFLCIYSMFLYGFGTVILRGEINTIPYMVLGTSIFFFIGAPIGILLLFSQNILILPSKIHLYWKIGNFDFGRYIPKFRNYIFEYRHIDTINNLYPSWIPLNYITIKGKKDGKQVGFTVGSLIYWKYKPAIYLISQHVHRSVFDHSTWKLVEEYEKKYGASNRTG